MISDRVVTVFAFASFFWFGVWGILRPAGIIGWARRSHPELRAEDPTIVFYVRFVGASFIAVSILAIVAILYWF